LAVGAARGESGRRRRLGRQRTWQRRRPAGMAQVKLLGPDLATPVVVPVETTMTVFNLKEKVLTMWPSGMEVPLVSQLRIIHQGRFLTDNQALKDCKVTDGETTAMHLIIKAKDAKPMDSGPGGDVEKASSRCTCLIS